MAIYHPAPLRLNLGAGAMVIEGWQSVGLDESHDVRCDIRKLYALFDEASVDAMMAIHVLEHINRWEVPEMLRMWRSLLKPGGTLSLELPELKRCCRNVLDNPDPRQGIWGLFGDPGYRNELMVHRWAWTGEELIAELRAAGFKKVNEAALQFHGRKRLRDMRVECVK